MEEISSKIKAYFKPYYEADLEFEDNLFEKGALDSMGIISLMTHIENEFKVSVDPEELTEDNFETVAAISKLISSKI